MVVHFVFDLDGTLYSFSRTGMAKQMRARINEFLSTEFHITLEEADRMADLHYQKYGLTARGIQIEHNVSDATLRKYCGFVHLLDLTPLKYNGELAAALTQLNSFRHVELWVLTNAIRSHAACCLAQLGIAECFRDPRDGSLRIVDCFDQWRASRDVKAECKPMKQSFEHMAQHVCNAQAGDVMVMVEDALHNLTEPKRLGWQTIWISDGKSDAEARSAGHVIARDIQESVPHLMRIAQDHAPTASSPS